MDRFVVQLRLQYASPDDTYHPHIETTGYKELFDSLLRVRTAESCPHVLGRPPALELRQDAVVLKYYYGEAVGSAKCEEVNGYRIWICPTMGMNVSRWYTIRWLHQQKSLNGMLKGLNCCVACAVSQAREQEGRWCVIT